MNPRSVANLSAGSENHIVKKKGVSRARHSGRLANKKGTSEAQSADSFAGGSIVLATLREPREKFWGALIALDPAGVSLKGIELSSFEDATRAFVGGEPLNAAVLFFPMHRVERIAMDLPEGGLPSLSQRFQTRTGMNARQALAESAENTAVGGAGA